MEKPFGFERKENQYIKHLKEFIGKKVTIEDHNGNKHTGVCKSINFSYLNVIIATGKDVIVVKNPSIIKRAGN